MRKDTTGDMIAGITMVIVAVLFIVGVFFLKKFQRDECMKIGHSKAYCDMQALGCFDKRR